MNEYIWQKNESHEKLLKMLTSRLVQTVPCLAAFMSSLTVISVALDRHRVILSPHLSQVRPVLLLMNTETNTKTVFTWDWILDPGYFQVTCFFYCYFRLRNLRQGDLCLTGWIPLCLPDSARHPGHLCSAGLASLHQVAAGQPGAAGGELSCLSCLLTSTNFPLLSAGPATPRHGSSPTFLLRYTRILKLF